MRLWREIILIVSLVLAVFLCLSLVTYDSVGDPGLHRGGGTVGAVHNMAGKVGAYAADLLLQPMGACAFLLPVLLLGLSTELLWKRSFRPMAVPFAFLFILSLMVLLALIFPERPTYRTGGYVGLALADPLRRYFNIVGAYLVSIGLMLLSIRIAADLSLVAVVRMIGKALFRMTVMVGMAASAVARSLWLVSKQVAKGCATTVLFFRDGWRGWRESRRKIHVSTRPEIEPEIDVPEPPPPVVKPPKAPEPPKAPKPRKEMAEEKIEQVQKAFEFVEEKKFTLPSAGLLDKAVAGAVVADHGKLRDKAAVLENKLKDFGINGSVTEIHPGPVITLYEFAPAPGIKVSRIVGLADDLMLALKAMSVRIVAPVPGKAVVGIEISNTVREMVSLRQLICSEEFITASKKSNLILALGKDISGKPFMADLARMPHLLIAGATGTGKSMLINTLICSILYQLKPEDLRLIMIDPKMLELSHYEEIPHLLHSVVTDTRDAPLALAWAVQEMESRYRFMADKGVRNINDYNRKVEAEKAKPKEKSAAPEGEAFDPADVGVTTEEGKLPYIVIIIDELADLMLASARQVEESITRLAQMARAAGIHLILATQRPSVDILTGIIKANLPCRLSLAVSSRIDSRTILDTGGAEKLLGKGDMLFLPPGTSKVIRLHGAYVSTGEISNIVEFLKVQASPQYLREICEPTVEASDNGDDLEDERYMDAVRLVVDTGQASISMVQRRLRVGYNRAARMIEQMERARIVGPQDGVKQREVLIDRVPGEDVE